jgi:hypothetical protein
VTDIYPRDFIADLGGKPLDNGAIYIGVANQDPQTNPIQCYWDAALTVPASQPIAVYAGYTVNNGSRADVYTASGTFSVRIRDKSGAQVDYIATTRDWATILGSSAGAGSIGAATGGTVEDAIWHKGRVTPIAGSKMAIRWVRDDATYPLENEAGIWVASVVTDHGISATFDSADGGAGSPCAGLFVLANNDGSPGDVCAAIFSAVARANSTTVFGANIIARGSSAHSNVNYIGAEIDVVPHASDTSINSSSGGLFLNIFNHAIAGPAIQIGGVSSGTFGNGIVLGGIATTGAGLLLGSGSANSLINTTVGTFTGAALTLGSGVSRGVKWDGNGGQEYYDGSNHRLVLPTGGQIIVRNSTDTTSNILLGTDIDLAAGGKLKVSGTQVVGARDTGWTAMTGTPDKASAYATGTVTLPQLAGRVKYLQDVLTAHGLIGA